MVIEALIFLALVVAAGVVIVKVLRMAPGRLVRAVYRSKAGAESIIWTEIAWNVSLGLFEATFR